MSFASYKPLVSVDKFGLNGVDLTSGSEQTVYQNVLPKGTYFVSFCPMITGSGDLSLVTAEIGSDLGGVNEQMVCQWYGTPYNYYNMRYEQICMAGTYISDGILPLTVLVSCTASTNWNYINYDQSAYNLLIMRLT